eukprot:GEMP01059904.1.p1 GENE.GEMP01059904.1~~GEMP01059904.1.p1  ORF type:complete len:278 (+),score=56.03 GEMP01059904.1:47-835(+)
MELVLKDIDMFADIFESLRDLFDYVHVVVAEDGIKISQYDRHTAALIMLDWTKEYFLKYQIQEPTVLNINPTFMLQILKLAPAASQLKMTRNSAQDGDDILYLEFTGADGRVCKCEMTLYESDADANPLVVIPFEMEQMTNVVHMTTLLWTSIVRDFKTFSPKLVAITVNPDAKALKLSIEADLGRGATNLQNVGDACEMELTESSHSDFSMDYVGLFRAPRSSKRCHLYISHTTPLSLVYDLGKNAEYGTLKFTIAAQAQH